MPNQQYLTCAFDDDDLIAIRDCCDLDSRETQWTEEERRAFDAFKTNPALILPRYLPREDIRSAEDREKFKDGFIDAYVSSAFSRLFCVEGGDRLFYRIPKLQSFRTDECKVLCGDTPPMQVLFYALGYSEASRLPGNFGNMVIFRKDLDQALGVVKNVMTNINPEAWTRARRVISACSAGAESKEFDQEIGEIFSVLPEGIERARSVGKNFLGFGFWLG